MADVAPGTPVELAGIKARDVIVALNGKPVDSVPQYYETLYHIRAGDKLNLSVLRDTETLNLEVSAIAARDDGTTRTASQPLVISVPRLGVLCSELGSRPRVEMAQFRSRSGVLVEAKAISNDSQSNLAPSDVIRAVNLMAVSSVAELDSALKKIKPGTPIVLQVERKSEFIYLPVNPD